MKGKLFLILLFLILVLGCTQKPEPKSNLYDREIHIPENDDNNEIVVEDLNVPIAKEIDVNKCFLIENILRKDECYSRSAIVDLNVDSCLEIGSEKLKETCINSVIKNSCDFNEEQFERDECIQNFAKKLQDYTICSKLLYLSKDSCIKKVAIESTDPTLCNKVSDQKLIYVCKSEVYTSNKKLEVCYNIEEIYVRDKCINKVGKEEKDGDMCILISDVKLKDDCLIEVAKESNQSKLCKLVSYSVKDGDYLRETCFSEFLEDANAISFCDYYIVDENKTDCLREVAVNMQDIEPCLKISTYDENAKEEVQCVFDTAIETEKYLFCKTIEDYNKSFTCLEEISEKIQTFELCSFLFSPKKDECFYNLAVEENDEKYCWEITGNRLKKDKCFFEVAKEKEDGTICSKMSTSSAKKRDECFSEVAKETKKFKFCNFIVDRNDMIECFSDISINEEDIFICNEISKKYTGDISFPTIDECFRDYIIDKLEQKDCNNLIKSFDPRTQCYKHFEDN